MKLGVLKQGSRPGNFIDRSKGDLISFCMKNNIEKASIVYSEIMINESIQFCISRTENLENLDLESLIDIFYSDLFFVIGDRNTFAYSVYKEDREVIIFYEDNLEIPNNLNLIFIDSGEFHIKDDFLSEDFKLWFKK